MSDMEIDKSFFLGETEEETIEAAPAEFRPFARALFGAMKETGSPGVLFLAVNADWSCSQAMLMHPETQGMDPEDVDYVFQILHRLGAAQAQVLRAMHDDDDEPPEMVS